MKRRSILGMFAAAPVAAVVNPNHEIMAPSPETPNFSKPLSSWSSPFDDICEEDKYGLEQDPLKKAMMRREALYDLYKSGVLEDEDWDAESFNITSLKATSPVRKAQLQKEWRTKMKLLRADANVERTIKKALLPKWMHRWT